MKKLLLIVLFFTSCSGPGLNGVVENEFKIIDIHYYRNRKPSCKIESTSTQNGYIDYWCECSDTVKIGQILKLK